MEIYQTERIVKASEIDELNHVNNVVYLSWVQDIANKHWSFLTKNNPQENYVWMVIRHEIDYKSQAVLDDKITVKTWVGETAGVKSTRHVEIFKNTTLLAKAQTTFCMLDAKTHKPARITESIINLLKPT